MTDENFFSEKQFKEIREKILKLFDGKLSEYFNVKKSTYKWSRKNNWIINVSVTKKWRPYSTNADRDDSPKSILKIVNLLFQTMTEFIEDEDNGFYFKDVDSRTDFGFNFIFLPKVVAAKKLLEDARF